MKGHHHMHPQKICFYSIFCLFFIFEIKMVSSSRKLCENVSCSYPGIVRGRTTAEYEPCKDNRRHCLIKLHSTDVQKICSSEIG